MEIIIDGITKKYNRRTIFEKVSSKIQSGQSLAITGYNGTGKTTLVKIIAGLIAADKGEIKYLSDNKEISKKNRQDFVGLVGPYLQLYDDLSAYENLNFAAQMRSIKNMNFDSILDLVGLKGRGKDFVKNYSSGMKQRLKYAFALLHESEVLLLDEPTSNLDVNGMKMVHKIMQKQKEKAILVFATNDQYDLEFADKIIEL